MWSLISGPDSASLIRKIGLCHACHRWFLSRIYLSVSSWLHTYYPNVFKKLVHSKFSTKMGTRSNSPHFMRTNKVLWFLFVTSCVVVAWYTSFNFYVVKPWWIGICESIINSNRSIGAFGKKRQSRYHRLRRSFFTEYRLAYPRPKEFYQFRLKFNFFPSGSIFTSQQAWSLIPLLTASYSHNLAIQDNYWACLTRTGYRVGVEKKRSENWWCGRDSKATQDWADLLRNTTLNSQIKSSFWSSLLRGTTTATLIVWTW